MDKPLWQCDAVELAELTQTGAVSCREVVEAHVERMEEVNPVLNAVVLSLREEALVQADVLDRARLSGQPMGILHGVPLTTKVNTDQAGTPTDNGVVAFKANIAHADNPCIANLKRAGAIPIGRTNTPAFSMRWHTANGLHGETLNPWHSGHTPGGSSGGAASSVAAGMAPIGQGNDIAGSIRYPAFCCGLVGLRPSYGRVPAFNPSAPEARPISAQLMAVQGPLTRTVRDARVALAAMAVGDAVDARWVDTPLIGPPLPAPTRVALVTDPARRGVNPEMRDAVTRAGRWLEESGFAVESVEPPELGELADHWAKVAMDDVIRSLEGPISEYGDAGIKAAVGFWRQGSPLAGSQMTLDALAERDRFARLWQLFLEDYPLIVMPSSGEPAFPNNLDTKGFAEYQRLWKAQLPQLAIPVLGLPAIAVPTGLHEGLPIGVQIVSRRFREDWCLEAAEVIEGYANMTVPIDPLGVPS